MSTNLRKRHNRELNSNDKKRIRTAPASTTHKVDLSAALDAVGAYGVPENATARQDKQPVSSKTPHHDYEFGGPIGATLMVFGLPIGIMFLIFAIKEGEAQIKPTVDAMTFSSEIFSSKNGFKLLRAFGVCVGWFVFQAFLERVVPGELQMGLPIPDDHKNHNKGGERLLYKVNGHRCFWLSLILELLLYKNGMIGPTYFQDNIYYLAAAAIIFSFVLSGYLYFTSFIGNKHLADGGTSGNFFYDFWMGRELNPRIAKSTFDLKYFCELRPGLIGWTVINLGLMMESQSLPLRLVVLLQGLYVWDALYYEQAILSTMDITTEGFGYMLAMGDLAWVPFTYTLQALYLVDVKAEAQPSIAYCLLVFLLGIAGYWIFRESNGEKDAFRRDFKKHPERFTHLDTMETKRGTRLIISSWWGMARKINYTADLMMAFSWSLLCGAAPVAYFYPAYMTFLLLHRASRDDKYCKEKYGDDWEKYKQHVPYILVPGIY